MKKTDEAVEESYELNSEQILRAAGIIDLSIAGNIPANAEAILCGHWSPRRRHVLKKVAEALFNLNRYIFFAKIRELGLTEEGVHRLSKQCLLKHIAEIYPSMERGDAEELAEYTLKFEREENEKEYYRKKQW